MSFLKKLFGEGSRTPQGPVQTREYEGFVIEARPFRDETGQYQLAGTIVREKDGVRQEKPFIRADKFSNIQDAATVALTKGRQIIDEQGERVFDGT